MFDFINGLSDKKSKKKKEERTFTIHEAKHVDGCPTKFSRADYTGRYSGSSPSGAAAKALTQLCSVKELNRNAHYILVYAKLHKVLIKRFSIIFAKGLN